MDVIALGEILIDFSEIDTNSEGYPTLAANPGGAPANFLTPIAKYGLKAAMIGKVGNDAFGKLLVNTLKKNHIDTKNVIVDDSVFTTLAFVTNDASGERDFSFARKPGADTKLKYEEIDLSLIDKSKVFHFGTLSLTNKPSKDTTKKIVNYAKKKNKLISFDPNLRKPLWNNLEDAKKAMLYGLNKADIVKISDEEVEFLFNIKDKDASSFLLNKFKNIKLLYVTCGSKGVYYATRKHSGFIKALNNIKVIDTTGAGDIFGGSAMYKFLKLNKNINDLTNEDLINIVKFATISAGLSTTKQGGICSVVDIETINDYLSKSYI